MSNRNNEHGNRALTGPCFFIYLLIMYSWDDCVFNFTSAVGPHIFESPQGLWPGGSRAPWQLEAPGHWSQWPWVCNWRNANKVHACLLPVSLVKLKISDTKYLSDVQHIELMTMCPWMTGTWLVQFLIEYSTLAKSQRWCRFSIQTERSKPDSHRCATTWLDWKPAPTLAFLGKTGHSWVQSWYVYYHATQHLMKDPVHILDTGIPCEPGAANKETQYFSPNTQGEKRDTRLQCPRASGKLGDWGKWASICCDTKSHLSSF